jgi:hypothetical protein
MILPDTAKPTTETVSGLRNVEQLGGQPDKQITETTAKIQARALRRLFSLCQATAYTIASHAFAVSR